MIEQLPPRLIDPKWGRPAHCFTYPSTRWRGAAMESVGDKTNMGRFHGQDGFHHGRRSLTAFIRYMPVERECTYDSCFQLRYHCPGIVGIIWIGTKALLQSPPHPTSFVFCLRCRNVNIKKSNNWFLGNFHGCYAIPSLNCHQNVAMVELIIQQGTVAYFDMYNGFHCICIAIQYKSH